MSTTFIAKSVWQELRKAAKGCRGPADVAVAYFSQGASKLLPLPSNSRLVVDASERSVRAGLTCPSDLLVLLNRGTQIFNIVNLHAKVYVFGTCTFVGSANASEHSANRLVEAMIRTTDRKVVTSARGFVRALCQDPLSPEMLKRLQKMYRPPRFLAVGVHGARRRKGTVAPQISPLRIAHLEPVDWTESDHNADKAGWRTANQLRQRGRSWAADSFGWKGQCAFQPNDRLLRVFDDGNGRVVVEPLATVLYVHEYTVQSRKQAIVYVEFPEGRSRSLERFAKQLGPGSKVRLKGSGLVRNVGFASAIRAAWEK